MRRPLVAGNWKLHKTIAEAVTLAKELKQQSADITDVDIVIAPVFTALAAVAKTIEGSAITLAGQNCYPEAKGAFTGEVSPPFLKDAGCRYVIVGHSERRQIFREFDSFINRKVQAVAQEGLTAILCLGETLDERLEGKTFAILESQLLGGLKEIKAETMQGVIIAYEPVWAIGTGKNATSGQAQEVHHFLRQLLEKMYDMETAIKARILYGGSVKPDNAAEILAQTDIDGALVGGASLKAADFLSIIRSVRK